MKDSCSQEVFSNPITFLRISLLTAVTGSASRQILVISQVSCPDLILARGKEPKGEVIASALLEIGLDISATEID